MGIPRLVAACLVAFGLAAVGGEGETPDETAKLITYLAREFNYSTLIVGATPTKRIEEIVADDVVIVRSSGERSTGKAECLQRIAKAREDVRGLFKDFAVAYDVQKVRLLGDAAIILAKVTLLGTLKEDDAPFRHEVWQTLVFARTDAGWRLVHEHANYVAAPKPAETPPKEVPQ